MLLYALLTATIAWAEPDFSEPALLWEQAQSDYQAHHFSEAYFKLKRLTEKYPTHQNRNSALLQLGHCALEAGHLVQARAALRQVIAIPSPRTLGHQARIHLARLELKQGRIKNALLTTLELDRQKSLDPDLRAEGLILKSQALLASEQLLAAERALDSALTQAAKSARLKALERSARLSLKIALCERETKPTGSEIAVRNAMESRGVCLLEALTVLQVINAQPEFWERDSLRLEGARTWSQAFQRFWAACEAPPNPPAKPKRTAAQLAAWRSELQDYLLTACNQTRTQATAFLSPFQAGADLELLKQSLER